MSSHIFSDEQLIAFALGELDDAESEHVARHIADCAQCRGTVASFQGIRASLREDDSVVVPPATLARAQAIFRRHASISQPGWLELLRRGPLPHARQLAGVSALAILLLTLALLYGSARVFAPAVQATLPGDPLYPVKTTMEDVRVAVALDDSTKVRAQLSIAQARVTEINELVVQGRYDFLPKTTQDYEEHVQQATATLGEVLKQDPGQVALAQKAEQDLARHEVSLAALQENSPGDVKPQIHQAVIASTAAKSTVQNQLSNISNSSSATPTPFMTLTPNVVITATIAPASPAVTNTLAPAPTIVITQPGEVATPSPSIGSPTTASASPSNPAPSASPIASLPATTKTIVPATSTALPTGTSVAPTGTPPATKTGAPTSSPGPTNTAPAVTPPPTNTLPAATTTATTTLGSSTPTLVSPSETPIPAPTPAPSTPTPVPASASQTAIPTIPGRTPATSVTSTPQIGPTSTVPALPTSTSSTTVSGGSPSFTGTPVPNPTPIPPGPSATTAPAGTLPVTGGTTPVSGTPSASNVVTPAAPTPSTGSGTSSPSAGSGSAGGTKPLPVTPNSGTGSTTPAAAPTAGSGASATSLPPTETTTTSGAPTVTQGSSGASSTPPVPFATVGAPVETKPAAMLPVKGVTQTTGLVTDLVDSTDTRAFCSVVGTAHRVTDDRQMTCDNP